MITSDKNIEIFEHTCECGRIYDVGTNQPSGDLFPTICTCYRRYNLFVTEGEAGKYSYKMREETRRVREGITAIYNDIKRRMTVRQVFYQAVSRGLVPKSENEGYNVIQRNLLEMRRLGHLPYRLVADVSRRYMKQETYNGLGAALDQWMDYYRQDMWANKDIRAEIWLEKEALSGIFYEVTNKFDVPLYLSRGFSSESFLFEAAEMIKESEKITYIYFFSDYDPSGLALCKQVEDKLKRFGADIIFQRVALDPWHIHYYNLQTRPTKKTTHSRGFKGESVELDALHPDILHGFVENSIMQHFTEKELHNLDMEEKVQRESLQKIKNNFVQA